MAETSISHVLLVAGPSGAGKSAFLSELAAGRLQPDVLAHLPHSADSWREVWCNRPKDWQSFLMPAAPRLPGLAVHYDITLKWLTLGPALGHDPFWQVLDRCQSVTLVNIRPPRERLLDQWTHAHLGVRGVWNVRRKTLMAAWSPHLLAVLRKLCAVPHPRKRKGLRYRHPFRFLKHLDRRLRNCRIQSTRSFEFYSEPGNIEGMLRSWDAVVAAKISTLPVKRIELVPDHNAEIGRTFGWRVVAVEPVADPNSVSLA